MHVYRRHFRIIDETTGDNVPACGVGPRYRVTALPGDVTCLRCQHSTAFPRPGASIDEQVAIGTETPQPEVSLLTWREDARERARSVVATIHAAVERFTEASDRAEEAARAVTLDDVASVDRAWNLVLAAEDALTDLRMEIREASAVVQ